MNPVRLSGKARSLHMAFAIAMTCLLTNPLPGSCQLLNLGNVLGTSRPSRNAGLVGGLVNGLGLGGVVPSSVTGLVDGVVGGGTNGGLPIVGNVFGTSGVPILGNVLGTSGIPILGNGLGTGSVFSIVGNVLGSNTGLPVVGNIIGSSSGLPIVGNILGANSGLPIVGSVLPSGGGLPVVGQVLGGKATAKSDVLGLAFGGDKARAKGGLLGLGLAGSGRGIGRSTGAELLSGGNILGGVGLIRVGGLLGGGNGTSLVDINSGATALITRTIGGNTRVVRGGSILDVGLVNNHTGNRRTSLVEADVANSVSRTARFGNILAGLTSGNLVDVGVNTTSRGKARTSSALGVAVPGGVTTGRTSLLRSLPIFNGSGDRIAGVPNVGDITIPIVGGPGGEVPILGGGRAGGGSPVAFNQ